MKYSVLAVGCAAVLASCNKGPEVNLHNASVNEVSHAVRESGMMNGGVTVQPGLWESKVTVQEMSIPGMPAQYAGKMKQVMAEHQQQSSKHCLTPAEAKRPKEGFFTNKDDSCKYDHFTMGNGKIDIAMVCKGEGFSQNTVMSGTYTPTSYSMDMASKGAGGDQQGMTMKMHIDAKRVGECTGKDEG
jgi:hypothetical protein